MRTDAALPHALRGRLFDDAVTSPRAVRGSDAEQCLHRAYGSGQPTDLRKGNCWESGLVLVWTRGRGSR
ncbi:MAG: hypothetical protein ACE5HP_05420 [Gemmatimonadota bacterium]